MRINQPLNRKKQAGLILLFFLLGGCTLQSSRLVPTPISTVRPVDGAFSDDEVATLNSLEQVDDFPLYTLHYFGAYPQPALTGTNPNLAETVSRTTSNACEITWGCSLFAALGDPANRLYGRNFDWRFSPAVLLFTDPPDGYASVSMVDIEYLGFTGSRSKDLINLPLKERQALLDAPALPFDGMNEQGLVIGMAAVSSGEMRQDPNKPTIDQLAVMREILDHAATIDEAINILSSYNIEMSEVPLHYLIASAAGNSALVEFYQGKMVIFRNEESWQLATNFLVAATDGQTQGQCPRFDRINQELQNTGGNLTIQDALHLLEDVSQGDPQSQSSTQWSVVYDMTGGDVHIIMGRKYAGGAHTLHLSQKGRLTEFAR